MNLHPPRGAAKAALIRLALGLLVILTACATSACTQLPSGPWNGAGGMPEEQFTALTPPRAEPPGVRDLATDGTRVVTIGQQGGAAHGPAFMVSDDQGATWRPGALSADAAAASGGFENPSLVAAASAGADPASPRWLALGMGPGKSLAWTSADGQTWDRHPITSLDLKGRTSTRLRHSPELGFVVATQPLDDSSKRSLEIWHSTDGVAWQRLGTGLPDSGWIFDAEVHSSTIVVAGYRQSTAESEDSGGPVVWVSTDAGATWRRAEPPTLTGRWDEGTARIERVAWLGERFVATGRIAPWRTPEATFVAESTDGVTWTTTSQPEADGDDLCGDALAQIGDSLLLGMNRLWSEVDDALMQRRSADGTWTRVRTPAEPHGSIPVRLIDLVDAGGVGVALVYYWGSDRSPLWRTTDGGATFVEVAWPAPEPFTPYVEPRVLLPGGAVGHSSAVAAWWTRPSGEQPGHLDAPAVIEDSGVSIEGAAEGPAGRLAWGRSRPRGPVDLLVSDGAGYERVNDPIWSASQETEPLLNEVIATDNGWLAVGSRRMDGGLSALVATSPDGRTWTAGRPAASERVGEGDEAETLSDLDGTYDHEREMNAVTAHGAGFIAVGVADDKPAWWRGTPEGVWTRHELPASGAFAAVVSEVASHQGRVVALGRTRADEAAPWRTTVWWSADDGATWSQVSVGPDAEVETRHLTLSGDRFVIALGRADGSGVDVLAGTDGATWNPVQVQAPLTTASDTTAVKLVDIAPVVGAQASDAPAVDVLVQVARHDQARSVIHRVGLP